MIFNWDDANREHIARHQVAPDEAEQVIWNDPLELDMQVVEGKNDFLISEQPTMAAFL